MGGKDPVDNYESYLIQEGILDEEKIEAIKSDIKQRIVIALKESQALPEISVSTEVEVADLFASADITPIAPSGKTSEKRFIDAISDGMRQSMERHDKLVLMGQDIADYGGVFKVTDGFMEQFGKDRVRNTPLCESAILGAGLGLFH